MEAAEEEMRRGDSIAAYGLQIFQLGEWCCDDCLEGYLGGGFGDYSELRRGRAPYSSNPWIGRARDLSWMRQGPIAVTQRERLLAEERAEAAAARAARGSGGGSGGRRSRDGRRREARSAARWARGVECDERAIERAFEGKAAGQVGRSLLWYHPVALVWHEKHKAPDSPRRELDRDPDDRPQVADEAPLIAAFARLLHRGLLRLSLVA